jgi:hypothetical protein
MKQLFTIYLLFFAILSFGQSFKNTATHYYDSLPGVTLVTALKVSDITGRFHNTNGSIGYTLFFEGNNRFEKLGRDCVLTTKWDSGSWTIEKGKTIITNSSKGKNEYEIVKVDRYYFLIPLKHRSKFIKDFNATRARFKNAKPVTHDNITYTTNWMIAYSLIEKFYGKDLEDLDGT